MAAKLFVLNAGLKVQAEIVRPNEIFFGFPKNNFEKPWLHIVQHICGAHLLSWSAIFTSKYTSK